MVGLDEDELDPLPSRTKSRGTAVPGHHNADGGRRKRIADYVVRVLSPYYKEKRIYSKVWLSIYDSDVICIVMMIAGSVQDVCEESIGAPDVAE